MRCLVAFDKFKDALTARQACEVTAATLRAKHPAWTFDLCPLTDGGEGFTETLCAGNAARIEHIKVRGPRGSLTEAPVGFVAGWSLTTKARQLLPNPNSKIAIVGLASASGIELLPHAQRDPWLTTTLGTGELIEYALAEKEKVDLILLGVGGSATNDLGLGALAALGFKFFAANGAPVPVPTPDTWSHITRIEPSAPNLPPIYIACDVTNPLLGPRGATATFGPQKGLAPADVPKLETQMVRMAELLCAACGKSLSLTETPGTGATGGFPFGLMVGAGAKIVPGFDLVSTWLDLPARLAAADLVITGEGRFDATSLGGKGPGSLVAEAKRLGKPAHVFAGSVDLPAESGIKARAITPAGMPLAEALSRTAELLAATIEAKL